jgi:hypothetical protein
MNRFRKLYKVPEDAEEAIYFEAHLTKHGLKMKSDELKLRGFMEMSNARWGQNEAQRGDIIKITADAKGGADGTEALITIWEYDEDGAHDLISRIPAFVENEKIEIEWEFDYYEDTDEILTSEETEKGYSSPEYFFRVRVGGDEIESDLLSFKDDMEIELLGEDGTPIADKEYIIHLPDGSQRRGRLDRNGYARESRVSPGKVRIEFPDYEAPRTLDLS